MPYTPQTWVNDVSKLNATRLQHIEDGLTAAAAVADAAIPKAISGVATDKVPVYNGSAWVAQKLVNAQIDAAAAIAYSKLNLTGSIVPGDLSLPYTDYAASFAWTSNGTAPSLGNSAVVAKYLQIGKLVHYFFVLTFGSTATFGTGSYRFSLPVACASTSNRPLGHAELSDNSSGNYGMAMLAPVTTSTVQLVYAGTYLGAATVAAQTAPWTWAQSDLITANLVYLAA